MPLPHLPILNLAAYRFADLQDLDALREQLQEAADALPIKGTILLAQEGLNAFLAGTPEACSQMLLRLREIPGMADLEAKESWSESMPFRKMRVRIRPEIIRMNHPTIRPVEARAPAVEAQTLQRWLDQGHDDEGRPVVTLDTRNDFEVDAGRFRNAIDWRITKFTEFPDAFRKHQEALKEATVVSYCTGGIRCEKAAIFMRELGHERVYQLDGGILKYLELTDGRHWEGGCFVFDERRAVMADLLPPQLSSVAACGLDNEDDDSAGEEAR